MAAIRQTVAGDGSCYLAVRETTNGNVTLQSAVTRLPDASAAAPSINAFTLNGECPIGVVTSTRTFVLIAMLYSPAGSSPSASLFNSVPAPTLLRAVAG